MNCIATKYEARNGKCEGQGIAQVLQMQCVISQLKISSARRGCNTIVIWTLGLPVYRFIGVGGLRGQRGRAFDSVQLTGRARPTL